MRRRCRPAAILMACLLLGGCASMSVDQAVNQSFDRFVGTVSDNLRYNPATEGVSYDESTLDLAYRQMLYSARQLSNEDSLRGRGTGQNDQTFTRQIAAALDPAYARQHPVLINAAARHLDQTGWAVLRAGPCDTRQQPATMPVAILTWVENPAASGWQTILAPTRLIQLPLPPDIGSGNKPDLQAARQALEALHDEGVLDDDEYAAKLRTLNKTKP
ncbi:hypothetical protein THUN1379_24310 [Paludibacterium sp. THUN1379]|uniref:hypothetical protein n=1 Tax=Paludibacterium sp. THUN1379 TaxID=3112107 RepID=UPI003085743F|nr:hypothetical protein THUN1379_24310 [Paludibacterium sp. THUN1379]